MNAYDLVDVRVPIEIGLRRFEVRRLRLCDVLRILTRFDDHVREFVSAKQPDAAALLASLGPEDTADLFAFSLDPFDPFYVRKHLSVDMEKRVQVGVLIASVNDVRRVWDSLSFTRPDPLPRSKTVERIAPKSTVPPLLRVIDRIAHRYACDPHAVMLWSYEGFLSIVDVMDEEFESRAREAQLVAGLDPDLLDDSEIPVGPLPDLNRFN